MFCPKCENTNFELGDDINIIGTNDTYKTIECTHCHSILGFTNTSLEKELKELKSKLEDLESSIDDLG